jgi:hypothetical protein
MILDNVKSVAEIDMASTEGKLLIATLGRLSCQSEYSNRTPDSILQEMVAVAKTFK